MAELYVDINGEEPKYNRYYRRSLDKLKRMLWSLSKMKKFSNNNCEYRVEYREYTPSADSKYKAKYEEYIMADKIMQEFYDETRR